MEISQNILCTTRCADLSTPAAGAGITHCSSCGERVWLSPATRKAMDGKSFKVLCNHCLPPITEESQFHPLTSEQIKEIDHMLNVLLELRPGERNS